MSLPNTQKLQVDLNQTLAPNWYKAVFLGHIEKINQGVTNSHLEFDIINQNRHIWAVLPHQYDSLDKIKRLKQALGMTDDEIDLKPSYNKKIHIFVSRVINNNKYQNEVSDFATCNETETKSQPKKSLTVPQQVLIVDDQPEVANLIGNYVQKVGFTPVIVDSVDEAMQIIDPEIFLMIIADVIMPGKNGFDLVRFTHNKYPKMSVALISGYFDNEMENMQRIFSIDKIYRKPVFFQAVKEMIANSIKKIKASNT